MKNHKLLKTISLLALSASLSSCATLDNLVRNQLNSTKAEQRIASIEGHAQDILKNKGGDLHRTETGAPYIISEGVVYVAMPNLHEVANSLGVDLSRIHQPFLRPGDEIHLIYGPEDGNREIKQTVATDGTIETLKGEISVNGKGRSQLNKEIDDEYEYNVLVLQTNSFRNRDPRAFFLGRVALEDVTSGQSKVIDLPATLANATVGMGRDADFFSIYIPRAVGPEVNGMVAIGSLEELQRGNKAHDHVFGYRDRALLLSKDTPVTLLIKTLGTVNEIGDQITGITGTIDTLYQDLLSIRTTK